MAHAKLGVTGYDLNNFNFTLKALSPAFFIVSLLHLFLGPSTDNLLGAYIPEPVLSDAILDSQNRFYGVIFGLYGALFYLCATDLRKYATVLKLLLLFFFAGGFARVVSIILVGLPSKIVLVLLALELTLPIILFLWWKAIENKN